MDLLDAGILGDRHQLRRLAPALGVDVDEGRERPSHRLAVEAGPGAADSAGLLQLLYPLVHGRRRKVEARAPLLVCEGGVLGMPASQLSVPRIHVRDLVRLRTYSHPLLPQE